MLAATPSSGCLSSLDLDVDHRKMRVVLEGPPTDQDARLRVASADGLRGRKSVARPRLLGRLSADPLMNSLDVVPALEADQALLDRPRNRLLVAEQCEQGKPRPFLERPEEPLGLPVEGVCAHLAADRRDAECVLDVRAETRAELTPVVDN